MTIIEQVSANILPELERLTDRPRLELLGALLVGEAITQGLELDHVLELVRKVFADTVRELGEPDASP